MKIGVSSYSFSKYMHQTKARTISPICDLAKKMGYDAIEFIDLSLDVQPAASLTELAQAIRRHCEEIEPSHCGLYGEARTFCVPTRYRP